MNIILKNILIIVIAGKKQVDIFMSRETDSYQNYSCTRQMSIFEKVNSNIFVNPDCFVIRARGAKTYCTSNIFFSIDGKSS